VIKRIAVVLSVLFLSSAAAAAVVSDADIRAILADRIDVQRQGVGIVVGTRTVDDAFLVDVELPADLFELMVPHGSVCVDGVSLTVNALPAPGILQLSIIEYTLRHTTLGAFAAGRRVHVEGDVIGKYVRHLTAPYRTQDRVEKVYE